MIKMETKTTSTEKKAYHQPQLRDFGTVKEGTHTTTVASGNPDASGTSPMYTSSGV
jgi:hypothetical protein